MGKTHLRYFEQNVCYACVQCDTEITLPAYIESRVSASLMPQHFRGSTGTAYLFNKIINYQLGQIEQKELSSGLHTIQDVHCLQCDFLIGWHYVAAQSLSNNYKIGKTCLERALIKRVYYDTDLPISELPPPSWVQPHPVQSIQFIQNPPLQETFQPIEDDAEQLDEDIPEEDEEEEAEEEIQYEAYIEEETPQEDEYGEESALISESQTQEQVYTE